MRKHQMNVLCVEQDRIRIRQLKRDARDLVPGAHITICRDPCKAEIVARTKGCDVLLTDTVFDGLSLDGVMLAEQIQHVNPHVNIIFLLTMQTHRRHTAHGSSEPARFFSVLTRSSGWPER